MSFFYFPCFLSSLPSISFLFPLPSPSLCPHCFPLLSIASSVVVHGAGSRDATLQVTSLAQILLDSHCRTVHGYVSTHAQLLHSTLCSPIHPPTRTHTHTLPSFLELIQREWLDGGHPFSLRHTHVLSAPEKEKAPIFLLFIDAVWQVGIAGRRSKNKAMYCCLDWSCASHMTHVALFPGHSRSTSDVCLE